MRRVFGGLDPRARVLTVVAATLVVASTTKTALQPFILYFVLCVGLILLSRASGWYLAWRCLAASPFILLASGLLAFQGGLTTEGRPAGMEAALSVALKGYTAALLLSFLTATTELSELLWALRGLRSPESLNLILAMMYRYTGLLSEEHARLERARESRTTGPLGKRRYSLYARQLGNLFMRSWDRADRVHAAMLSRGFHGSWPVMEVRHFRFRDAAFAAVSTLLFLAARTVRY